MLEPEEVQPAADEAEAITVMMLRPDGICVVRADLGEILLRSALVGV